MPGRGGEDQIEGLGLWRPVLEADLLDLDAVKTVLRTVWW